MVMFFIVNVFFFKQMTAYELRISDWSSDVCSSGLAEPGEIALAVRRPAAPGRGRHQRDEQQRCHQQALDGDEQQAVGMERPRVAVDQLEAQAGLGVVHVPGHQRRPRRRAERDRRSEEHPSELQSLMRISYAVFCLKNKNKKETY